MTSHHVMAAIKDRRSSPAVTCNDFAFSQTYSFATSQAYLDLYDYTSFLQAHGNTLLAPPSQEPQVHPGQLNMSNQYSHFESKSFSSSSFSSSRNGEAPQTWSSTETRSSNPQGTTIHSTSQEPGRAPTQETLRLDPQGKPLLGKPQENARIEDVSDADREYSERIEDEYAKREGGA